MLVGQTSVGLSSIPQYHQQKSTYYLPDHPSWDWQIHLVLCPKSRWSEATSCYPSLKLIVYKFSNILKYWSKYKFFQCESKSGHDLRCQQLSGYSCLLSSKFNARDVWGCQRRLTNPTWSGCMIVLITFFYNCCKNLLKKSTITTQKADGTVMSTFKGVFAFFQYKSDYWLCHWGWVEVPVFIAALNVKNVF